MERKNYEQIAKKKFESLQEKIKNNQDVFILGIESSCDETSISVVKNGREILSNIVASQIPIHKRFGGVVPEVASRNHILAIDKIFHQALDESGCQIENIDAIAVTYGAGLMGALLVGVNFAKSLAYSLELPLIAVSHIKGHIAANYISHTNLEPPFICLMVSGGHTAILHINDYNSQKLIGTTIDDAAGEAFDKVARILGLGYPGGIEIDKLAKKGKNDIKFIKHNSLKDSFDFSFSGIKTAVINYVHNFKQKQTEISNEQKQDICASFQKFVVSELTEKTIRACCEVGAEKIVVAGGVGANSQLRDELAKLGADKNKKVFFPVLSLCTDNAAMIASAGFYLIKDGLGLSDLSLTAKPTVSL